MQDWRAKLGYVIPSWNTVIEYETSRMLPEGVSAHFSRITHTEDSPEALAYMSEQYPVHVDLLRHADVSAVCYACTGASFLQGRAHDERYMAAQAARVPTPMVSMAGAIVEAARHLGLRRLAVAAPYEPWLLQLLLDYLGEAGFEVVRSAGLNQQANILHAPRKALELAERAWDPAADGLILSCGNFRTLEMIGDIERQFGKPALTSNQSALWSLLSRCGWRGEIPFAGTLLRTLS